MKKRFLLDISVLLYDVECLDKFGDNEVIIPVEAIRKLREMREENTERAHYAHLISQTLDEISARGKLQKGILHNETVIRTSYLKPKGKESGEPIVHIAAEEKAILITRDPLLRVIARDYVEVQDYLADNVGTEELYKGYRRVQCEPDLIQELCTGYLPNTFGLYPNEFLILENHENKEHTAIGINKNDRVRPLFFESFNSENLKLKLRPLNLEQKMLLHLLLDPDILCVCVIGTSGKGKTLLTTDYALASVEAKLHNQMIYTKSIMAVDKQEDLGFFPGHERDKMTPHIQPLFDAVEVLMKESARQEEHRQSIDAKMLELFDSDVIRTVPLAQLRGRSLVEKVSVLDEAQNTSNYMMKTFITRHDKSSKTIVMGDVDQIDDRNLHKFNNGLSNLIEKGKHKSFIGHISMDISPKSQRGQLATFGSTEL